MRGLGLLLLVACGAGADMSAAPGGGGAPVPVEVAVAGAASLATSWTLLGDVRPLSAATLASEVAARVEDVGVREGDRVEAGQVLVRLDDALASARLTSAQAALEQAEVDRFVANNQFTRIERVAEGVVAEAERVAAKGRLMGGEAGVKAAQARVGELRVELARHTVRAPWAGVVTRRFVDPGVQAQPGTALLALATADEVEVLVDGPAELLGAVTEGAEVTLRGAVPVAGRVVGIVPVLDGSTRTARLRVVPEATGALVPGSQVEVSLAWTRTDGDAVVPRDALVPDPAGTTLVRLGADGPERMPARVVATAGDEALVAAEGLAPGDRVVTKGNERLRPGTPVRVVGDE